MDLKPRTCRGDIMPITHPRQHNPQHRSRSLRRVLDEIAVPVGRAEGQGTPVLCRLKPEFRENDNLELN
jgi:hypothetical protein